jgi:hypothetical protein
MYRDEYEKIIELINEEKKSLIYGNVDYDINAMEWNRALMRCENILKEFINE